MFGAPVTPAIEAVTTIAPPSPRDHRRPSPARRYTPTTLTSTAAGHVESWSCTVRTSLDAGVGHHGRRRAELARQSPTASVTAPSSVTSNVDGHVRADGAHAAATPRLPAPPRRVVGGHDRPAVGRRAGAGGAADVAAGAGHERGRRFIRLTLPRPIVDVPGAPAGVEQVHRAGDLHPDRFARPPVNGAGTLATIAHCLAVVPTVTWTKTSDPRSSTTRISPRSRPSPTATPPDGTRA